MIQAHVDTSAKQLPALCYSLTEAIKLGRRPIAAKRYSAKILPLAGKMPAELPLAVKAVLDTKSGNYPAAVRLPGNALRLILVGL